MVTNISNPVQDALKKAKEEVAKEEQDKMVKAFKAKLKEVESAKRILKNLERELDDMEHEIGEL
jgi:uncharacterized Rossmann fold enzyme